MHEVLNHYVKLPLSYPSSHNRDRSEAQNLVIRFDASNQPPWIKIACCSVLGCVFLALTACKKIEEPPRNYALLASDVHVSIAHRRLVLPFISLSANRGMQSFSLAKKDDAASQANAIDNLMHESIDSENSKPLDRISLQIDTYGWDDWDMKMGQICPMLTRKWAQSVCDNPWAVVQQSLPNRIEIVDLRRLKLDTNQYSPRCAENSLPYQSLPARQGAPVIICEQQMFGGKAAEFYVAAVRIDGDLGAVWLIARSSQAGETGEARMARQGKAVVAFLQYGLGPSEDFSKLYNILCELRAPDSAPGPHHLDCGDTRS